MYYTNNGIDLYQGDMRVGDRNATAEEVDVYTNSKLLTEYTQVLDDYLLSCAKEKGYDSIYTASLRGAIPTSHFYTEGLAYAKLMDDVYAYGYAQLALVQSGERTIPTKEEFLLELPKLEL